MTKLIYSLDDEILIDACWAISYLSDGSNDKIQAVIESGVCRRLVDLLMHPSTSVQTPALRSVGNIVTGDDLQTQVVITSGALPALLSLLSSPKEGIRKEACWTISNITAGSPPQIQAVIDANIIPPLINILQNADFKTRKEACWAISNATSGGLQEPSQIRYLVSQGCIKPLCDLLTMMDNKIIQVALDGLDNILKVGEMDKQAAGPGAVNQYALYVEEAGGMVTIHNLQQHDNMEIYKKAFNIMDKYFPDDEEVDAGIGAANVDASGAFAVRVILSYAGAMFLTLSLACSSTKTVLRRLLVGSASVSSDLDMSVPLRRRTIRAVQYHGLLVPNCNRTLLPEYPLHPLHHRIYCYTRIPCFLMRTPSPPGKNVCLIADWLDSLESLAQSAPCHARGLETSHAVSSIRGDDDIQYMTHAVQVNAVVGLTLFRGPRIHIHEHKRGVAMISCLIELA